MRLWSLHPLYLDSKGLVALWREGLLARKVLLQLTRGYRRHPQLLRFQAQADPILAIETYLWGVYEEATRRGYHFNGSKLTHNPAVIRLPVTSGQLQYELNHLLVKLKQRDVEQYQKLLIVKAAEAHPVFQVVPGEIEGWERITSA